MAILDQPLFSEEATGKIRSTLTFFTRGERFLIIPKLSYRQNPTTPREAVKDQWRAGILAWHALSPAAQLEWGEAATGLQTGFNAFMEEFMSPTPCPPQFYDGIVSAFNHTFSCVFTFTPPTPLKATGISIDEAIETKPSPTIANPVLTTNVI